MARGVNKVILVGNLGQDPEIRHTQNGSPVATLNIATSESWMDKNTGQRQERTEWHRVVVFQKLAEICQQYLRKGAKVYLEGKLQTRKWQDKQGQDRYTTEIVANDIQMLDRRDDASEGSYQPASGSSQFGGAQQPQRVAQQPVNPPYGSPVPSPASNFETPAQDIPKQQPAAAPTPAGFNDFDDDIPF